MIEARWESLYNDYIIIIIIDHHHHQERNYTVWYTLLYDQHFKSLTLPLLAHRAAATPRPIILVPDTLQCVVASNHPHRITLNKFLLVTVHH
jgi:hypothetical protein